MAKLLCVTPWPGLKTHYGRIPAALIPLWKSSFETIDVWSVYEGPQEGEELVDGVDQYWVPAGNDTLERRYPHLGQTITEGGYTHIWIMGTIEFLYGLASLGLTQENLPDQLVYGYAIIEGPFVDTRHVEVSAYFDFFVCMSGMALGAYKELAAYQATHVPKALYKAMVNVTTILPGVDTRVFRPLDVYAGEPSREEIREAMFGDKVSSGDLLVMISGQKTRRKGLPQACSLLRQLQDLLPTRRVRGYFHMACEPSEQRPIVLSLLAEGNDLMPHRDVLWGDGFFAEGSTMITDEDLNLLYNAADIVLNTDLANGWCFTATEAIAAGTVVAAPNEHIWVDVVAGRGIELPCTEFGWAPWSANEFVRAVDPHAGAVAIANALADPDMLRNMRKQCAQWAASDEASWERSAREWLDLFGVS